MNIFINHGFTWTCFRKFIWIIRFSLLIPFIFNLSINRTDDKWIFFTTFWKFIKTTIFISTELRRKNQFSGLKKKGIKQTDLPGELNLNGFLSVGADRERSFSS